MQQKPVFPIVIPHARVVSGAGRGKKIGIATLNIELSSAPANMHHGIYACWVSFAGTKYMGALHYGPRPVFKDTESLEVHVLDSIIESPPVTVDLEIVARIRGVENFATTKALVERIRQDIAETRVILGS